MADETELERAQRILGPSVDDAIRLAGNPETMFKAEPFPLRRAPKYAGDQTITDIWKALEEDDRLRAVQESGTGEPGSIEEP